VGTAPSLDSPLLVTSCICHDRYDCWGNSVKWERWGDYQALGGE
jgi:hypothetical protein